MMLGHALASTDVESQRARKGSRAEAHKRSSLLQAIHRAGLAGRLQLSKALGISNSRVCDLVDEMIAQGLLIEQAVTGDRRGRRGVGVRLNPAAGHWIGLDMEAKRLRMVVTDFAGTMVWSRTQPLDPVHNGNDFLKRVLDFFDDALPGLREQFPRLRGIGLAASGVTDIRRGVILHYDMLPGVVDVPLRDSVTAHTGLPCVMENNIRAMTLAEWTNGAARGLSSFVCVAVRSGVGAGVVINGRLHDGSHGLAGEVGYIVVPNEGSRGEWPTLQQIVSESALQLDVDRQSVDLDPAVAARIGQLIGIQLASIAVVIDPEAIVLAGSILAAGSPVWFAAEAAFRATALPEITQTVKLLPAQLGPFAAAIGAAYRGLYEIAV